MKKIFCAVLMIFIFGAVNFSEAKTFSQNYSTWFGEVSPTANYAEEVLKLVNIERRRVGLKSLKLSGSLNQSAAIRAREIQKKFSHTRPNGSKCFTAIKISYRSAGENIAAGQISPKQVVEGWMNSKGHRENILNRDFQYLGVGYYNNPNADYEHYWVQLFTGY